jgi:hypothetical protein
MNKRLDKNLALLDDILDINEHIANTTANSEDKVLLLEHGQYWRERLEVNKTKYPEFFGSSTVKSIINDFLIYWNETIGLDSERFWQEIQKSGLNIKRKRSLRNVVKRGRFLDIHEVMSARNQWDELMCSEYIAIQFDDKEIAELVQIMRDDEAKRADLFRKCLRNNRLSKFDELRYCENMAYFTTYNLYKSYFTIHEIEEIRRIRQELQDRTMEVIGRNRPRK